MLPQGFLSNHSLELADTGVFAAAVDQALIAATVDLHPPKTAVLDRLTFQGDAAALFTIHTAAPTPLVLDRVRLGAAGTISKDCHLVGEPLKAIEVDLDTGNGSVIAEFHFE